MRIAIPRMIHQLWMLFCAMVVATLIRWRVFAFDRGGSSSLLAIHHASVLNSCVYALSTGLHNYLTLNSHCCWLIAAVSLYLTPIQYHRDETNLVQDHFSCDTSVGEYPSGTDQPVC